AQQLDDAELGGGTDVGTAAQFDGVVAHLHNTDTVPVLLTEHGQGTHVQRLVQAPFGAADLDVPGQDGVDLLLDLGQSPPTQCVVGGEVEPQLARTVLRTGLSRGRAQSVAQCRVEEVGRRVGAFDRVPTSRVDRCVHRVVQDDFAGADRASVHEQAGQGLLYVLDVHDPTPLHGQRSGVGELATALGVEGGAVQDDLDLVTRTGDQDPDPVHDDALDLCLAREVGVAEKLGVSGLLVHLRVEGDVCVTEFLGLGVGLGGLTLTLHELTESVLVDAQALFGGHLQGQIDGETIGVVELEGVRSGEDRAPGGAGAFGGTPEQCRARAQGFGEVLLLVVDHAVDDLGLGPQVGVDVLHRVDADLGQLVQEGGVGTREQAQIADGAAQDTAQDVTGLFVTGLDPVTDEHDGAAHVVGDHTEHDVLFVVVTVAGAGQLRGTLEDTTDDVGLVDVVDVLQDRGEPLQA